MKIAVDIMGGDHAPQALIAAVRSAAIAWPERRFLAVALPECLDQFRGLDNIEPVPCGSVMEMDEDVRGLMKKKDSSIWVATDLVKQQAADAVVSAGSTAAQMTAATLLLGRIRGVARPAIGTLLPTAEGPRLMLDAGANADCDADMLLQFALMGDVYARCMLNMPQPRIALLANGTEDHKGSALTHEAFAKIAASGLHFIGNREGRDLLQGGYDVMVTDGMSGNIALKSLESAATRIMSMLKQELTSSLWRKVGASMVKQGLAHIKRKMDYQEYGGAPLFGVRGVSVVCHGSSGERAIFRALDVAAKCLESGLVGELTRSLEPLAGAPA